MEQKLKQVENELLVKIEYIVTLETSATNLQLELKHKEESIQDQIHKIADLEKKIVSLNEIEISLKNQNGNCYLESFNKFR